MFASLVHPPNAKITANRMESRTDSTVLMRLTVLGHPARFQVPVRAMIARIRPTIGMKNSNSEIAARNLNTKDA